MEKILITGTGRCGTTFLIKLFSFLGFNTGYNRDNYKNYISENCNSGMERRYNENYYIVKNPIFMHNINYIVQDSSVKIKYVIIPIRDLKHSAMSRVKNGNNNGGFVNAINETTQLQYYKDILTNYLYCMTKYELNTIFIDFDKMVKYPHYLFDKLKVILDEKSINYERFYAVYNEVTSISKP